jgi:preprotein translocase SecE subunit
MKDTVAASADEQPERRKPSAEGGVFSSIGSLPKRTKAFLDDVRAETKRVTWPSFAVIRGTTVVVIITVFFFGAYFGILDWLYTRAIGWILRLGQ